MAEFRILVEGNFQHAVKADDAVKALKKWLDEQGYDSVEHAADEYYCMPSGITVEQQDDFL